MTIETKKTVTTKTHPLETMFNIEPNTTEVVKSETVGEALPHSDYDAKDSEIDTEYQEIINKAVDGFESLMEIAEDADPKYAARMMEVANQFLNTALSGAAKKADHKHHKDKLTQKVKPNKTINNTLVINRNDLLAQLSNTSDDLNDIIDIIPQD